MALVGPDAAVELADGRDERDAAELSAAFADWLAAAALPAGSVRTCFRLVEPQAELFAGPLAAASPAHRKPEPVVGGADARRKPGGSSFRCSRLTIRA